jgi:hypothetical protein
VQSIFEIIVGVRARENARHPTKRRIFGDNGDHDNAVIMKIIEVTIIMFVTVTVIIKGT